MNRSLAFYRDLLGIPLESDDPSWAEAAFASGVRFALHQAQGDEPELGSGTLRVNLEVADVDEAAERLRAQGVEVGEIVRDVWGAACPVRDPDGYRLELCEPSASATRPASRAAPPSLRSPPARG